VGTAHRPACEQSILRNKFSVDQPTDADCTVPSLPLASFPPLTMLQLSQIGQP